MARDTRIPYRLITPRAVVIALVTLLVLDMALRFVPALRAFPDDYRFPAVTTMGFFDYVDWMERTPGARVAVLGDSVGQGLHVDRANTLAADLDRLYREQGRDARAFNFALSGAHGNDVLAEVSHITSRKAADVLVIQISWHMYLPQRGMINWIDRYPQLWKDPSVFAPFDQDPLVRLYTRYPEPGAPPTRLSTALGSVWRLYDARDTYTAIEFEKTVPQAYGEWFDRAILDKPAPEPRTHPDLKGYNQDRMRGYTQFAFDPNTPHIRYLRLALARARAAGVPVVVVLAPLDVKTAEYFKLLTPERYATDVAALRSICESEGARFFDSGPGFPTETLGDFIHPLPAGYAYMAWQTEGAIEPEVKAAEERRKAAAR